MKTNTETTVHCPNCNKRLATVPEGTTFGKVRKALADAVYAHLPHCKHRGAALVEFSRMFGSAGNVGTLASMFKLLHDDEMARFV